MSRPLYKVGQHVSFSAEYMYAVMYPSGHTEVTTTIDGDGIVTDIEYSSSPFVYIISTSDLPDGHDEIYVDECDLLMSYDDLLDSMDDLFNI